MYYEPFLGGGAVFFSLGRKPAVLSDLNGDLINTYLVVRDQVSELLNRVQAIPVSSEEFYHQRRTVPNDIIDRAARFLYLNRTAFSGLYRLNSSGQFNVPFGGGERDASPLWRKDLLRKASTMLQGTAIEVADFQCQLDRAGPGDVCYCDPTYTVAHENNGFVRYNERNFSWADQQRLARAAQQASERGVTVIVSNAFHPAIRDLYPSGSLETLSRASLLSRKPESRRAVKEYLIVLRPRR
jgi:DNA adenine methylase